jgi:ribosomal protein L10
MTNSIAKLSKTLKVKHYLKKPTLIFFLHISNLNSKNWLKIEQELFNSNLKYYKINNTLTKYVLDSSIFSNLTTLINGSLCIIHYNNAQTTKIDTKKLLKINKSIPIVCAKLNNKVYSANQLSSVSTLNYDKNIRIFNKSLKKMLKFPYFKLKNSNFSK